MARRYNPALLTHRQPPVSDRLKVLPQYLLPKQALTAYAGWRASRRWGARTTKLIQGFVAVMVGGVGSFAGPVAGAGVIGTLAAALPWIMPPVVADVLVFVLAIIFIKFRPQGLLSAKGV